MYTKRGHPDELALAREYQKKLRALRRAQGRCIHCGETARPNKSACERDFNRILKNKVNFLKRRTHNESQ